MGPIARLLDKLTGGSKDMNYQTLTPELLEQLTAIAPGRVFAGSDINEDYSHDRDAHLW